MHAFLSLIAVVAIALAAWAGAAVTGLRWPLGVLLPAAGAVAFVAGTVWRVVTWAKSPVPFRIPVTCGQQASLPWLKASRFDNPSTTTGAVARMGLEVLLFRSLTRNVRAELGPGRLVYRDAAALWVAALAFHYSLLVVVVRHLRFLTEPVPALVTALASLDAFFQAGVPSVYATDVILVAALGYLLLRRFRSPQVRCLSLFGDYFFLFLLLGIATTGLLMRHAVRVDVVSVKELAMCLATLSSPEIPPSLQPIVFAHLALVSTLAACLPFTKLSHMAGVFLSPTRNLANDNRAKRHVSPWRDEVKVHTYEEWEEEFRDKLVAAGLPVEGRGDHV